MSFTDIRQLLPKDVYDAALGANSPTAANPFATIADLTGGSNLYNADGTLTNSRTINGNFEDILWDDFNEFTIQIDSAFAILDTTGTPFLLISGSNSQFLTDIVSMSKPSTTQQILRFFDNGATQFAGDLTNADLTGTRTWTLQDDSGVLAFLSDIPAATGNGIYDGSDSLSGNTTVTMGAFNMLFDGTGTFQVNANTFSLVGTSSFGMNSSGGSIGLGVSAGTGDVNLTNAGSGDINIHGIAYPKIDGSSGQAITTTGTGALGFSSVASPNAYDTGETYTVTNLTTNRTIDCNNITGFALRDVVGQMITDLQSVGIFS